MCSSLHDVILTDLTSNEDIVPMETVDSVVSGYQRNQNIFYRKRRFSQQNRSDVLSVIHFVVSPGGFNVCDFEEGMCEWNLTSLSNLKWVRTNQQSLSITDPLKGPGRDHSSNNVTGITENQSIFSQSVGCLISTEGMVQSEPPHFLKNFK